MVRFLFRSMLCLVSVLLVAPSLTAQEIRPTPAAAWQRLKEGNARFAADAFAIKDVSKKRRAELAQGQRPFAAILSCADSRVVPELLFDQGLGDLFVVRVAGNIAEPGMIGSVEYAVGHLHVPIVVVLAHEGCGAVQAALDGKPLPGQLGWLVKQVYTGNNLPAEKGAALAAGVRANALHQAAALIQQSSELAELVAAKRTQVVVGVYSLTTANVTWLELEGKAK